MEMNLVPEFELDDIDPNAIWDFIAEKGLAEEFSEWSKKRFEKVTGIKWSKTYERTGIEP